MSKEQGTDEQGSENLFLLEDKFHVMNLRSLFICSLFLAHLFYIDLHRLSLYKALS